MPVNKNNIAQFIVVILVLVLYLLGSLGIAKGEEALKVEWEKTFGGTSHDWAYSVQQTSDGGYIFAGITQSFGAGGDDAWLVKTDADGNHLWSKTFGGKSDDTAYSVQQTSDGGYIFAGITQSFGAGGDDAWLVKTDAGGNHLWSKTFGGADYYDMASYVQQTSDGGYIIAGTYSSGTAKGGAWLIRIDADRYLGNLMWSKTFGTGNDTASYVQQTLDGGYIVAGTTYSYDTVNGDAWLAKTDADGNQQWSKTFGGINRTDGARSVQQTLDGGYILAGRSHSIGTDTEGWVIKTDAKGNQQWNKIFGIYTSFAQHISDGGYMFVGNIRGNIRPYSADAWLIKTDASGNQQWNMTFGGTGLDWADSGHQTSDGGYIFVGITNSFGTGGLDAWLVKLSQASPTTPTPTPTPTIPTPTPITPTPTTPAPTATLAVKQPLLTVSQTTLKEEPEVGEEVLITVTVLNTGEGIAKNIRLTEQLPSSISISYIDGAISNTPNLVTWNGELAPNRAHAIIHSLKILEKKSRAIPVIIRYEDEQGNPKESSTTIYVEAQVPAMPEQTAPAAPTAQVPGFTALLLLVGLIAVILFARKR